MTKLQDLGNLKLEDIKDGLENIDSIEIIMNYFDHTLILRNESQTSPSYIMVKSPRSNRVD